MLYRPAARPPVASTFQTGLARVAGFVAELHRIATDRVYLDTLDEHALRDIGIQRIATRHGNIYR